MLTVEDILREHTANDDNNFARLGDRLDRFDARLDRLEALIATVATAQQKQVGFFAGVAAAVSVIVAGIMFAVQWLKS